MNKRHIIYWLIWLALVIGLIWFFVQQVTYGATVPIPGKKMIRKSAAEITTKGAGALQLISKASIIIPPKPLWVTYYFAATSSNSVGVSEFSNEVVTTADARSNTKTVTLAWDTSYGINVATPITYWIHKGRTNRIYTAAYPAGTNLTLSVPLAWPTLTNVVITVTSQNATNLQWCSALGQPWTKLGATNYTSPTNPATRFWRAMGRSAAVPGKAFIKSAWQ